MTPQISVALFTSFNRRGWVGFVSGVCYINRLFMQIAISLFSFGWQPVTCIVSVIRGPPQLNREEAISKITNCRLMREEKANVLPWISIFTRLWLSSFECHFRWKGDSICLVFLAWQGWSLVCFFFSLSLSLCLTDLPCRISPAVLVC